MTHGRGFVQLGRRSYLKASRVCSKLLAVLHAVGAFHRKRCEHLLRVVEVFGITRRPTGRAMQARVGDPISCREGELRYTISSSPRGVPFL
jgi:hypothetical protein